ncbi:sterol desaturase family protein [Marinomonas posidonica]|uniref:Fatty acid hydroxylase n=1 Tax=Marinomonas posidonica (strain CECT 7376 / NCIMB 14433 / IVIA-Po-181) TaxID=491952 RepID=F6CRZ7_MARPP|nr:sterol desaturase family protein [Marinomonas posidonica]AEF56104.1 fatty acid hydroxylase [Marinomonas posidonica IVIA-Po-181]
MGLLLFSCDFCYFNSVLAFSYVSMTYLDWLMSVLQQTLADLQSVQKRVSIWYLVSAFVVALGFIAWRYPGQFKQHLKRLFSPRVWWHKSARIDYAIFFINRYVMAFLSPRLLSSVLLTTWLYYQSQNWSPHLGDLISLPTGYVIALFTLCYFLLDDFSRFYLHRMLHKWPALWAFHRVHHSAKVLTPITVFRTHPVEGMLFFLRSSLIQAICIAGFVSLFPGQVSLYTVWGVSIFTFVFNVLGANLRHSHVTLSYGRGEKWWISPAQHQRHHSSAVEDYDCNFGVVLALWDRIFGSWKQADWQQDLVFGTNTSFDDKGLLAMYVEPFRYAFESMKRHLLAKMPVVIMILVSTTSLFYAT